MVIKAAIFDLDATLIDTQVIKSKLVEFLMDSCGFSKEGVLDIYKKVRNKDGRNTLSLEMFEDVLKRGVESGEYPPECFNEHKLAELKEWIGTPDESLVINGADKLLTFFKENKIPVYIITLGVRKWQLDKIKKTGLDKFFMGREENIKSTEEEDTTKGKAKEIGSILNELKIPDAKNILFFNDRPDETLNLLKIFPEMKVIVRREKKDLRHSAEDYEGLRKKGIEVFDDLDILDKVRQISI